MDKHITLIDAHVHIRHGFDPAAVLDAALEHFARCADQLGAQTCDGVLMLSESAGEHAFERLAGRDHPIGRWRFEAAPESCALPAERDDAQRLLIVQGQQIATADRLEVLTLACDERIDDGLSIAETLNRALDMDAITVLPWGFGKWTGQRRSLMLKLIRDFGPRGVAIGDSAGRPRGLPAGPIFREAIRLGLPILPGTDPLPIASHERRAGKFALALPGRLDRAAPAADLRHRLRAGSGGVVIGNRDGPLAAIASQLRLRLEQNSTRSDNER
ncbi:MAG TPA: hypothetical protein ENJ00_11440 [Phycisphaerales bacterium]|nr:hypothetical protein [Phycisphaerales bacterium]